MKKTFVTVKSILRWQRGLKMFGLGALFLLGGINVAIASSNEIATIQETKESLAKKKVSGKVVDNLGEPLISVSVLEKGTLNGVTTDFDGNFELTVEEGATLTISYIGYLSQDVVVGSQSVYSITLLEDTQTLDEVVIVAYGATRKKDLTGSLSAVDPDKIALQSTSTVTKALEGAVPGLQISSVDGQPGWDSAIRVRGVGSTNVNASGALVVIDGVPAQMENPLATLNPNDIANVSVLKDAASTALYGSRGANGVVLITTKKGQKGKVNIQFSSRWGWNSAGPFQTEQIDTASEYYEYMWKSIYNSYRYGIEGGLPKNYQTNVAVGKENSTHQQAALFASQHLFNYTGNANHFERNALGNYMAYRLPGVTYLPDDGTKEKASKTLSGEYLVGLDGRINPAAQQIYSETYQDYLLETRFRQEYNVSASDGTDRMDYFLSLGYLEDPSYIKSSEFKRYTGRLAVNMQLFKWMKIGANIAYTRTNTRAMATTWGNGRNAGDNKGNVFRYIKGVSPIVPVYAYNEDGSLRYNKTTGSPYTSIEGSTYSPLGSSAAINDGTDINYNLDNDLNRHKTDVWNTRTYAIFDIYDGLKFTFNFSMDQNNYKRTKYANGYSGRGIDVGGGIAISDYDRKVLNTQELLTYDKDFGKHHIDALAGHEYNDWKQESMNWGAGYELIPGFLSKANFLGRYKNTAGYDTPNAFTEVERMESFLGRLNYIYGQKYYASFSLRSDGSSKFKKDRWGTFWSVGGGWRPSEEAFMASTRSWLDNLKIRASYGVIGNQNAIGRYSGYNTWDYSTAYVNTQSGTGEPTKNNYKLTPRGLVNDMLTWEKTNTFDIGLDMSFLNRFHVTLDYYNRNTTNSFFNQPVSLIATGQESIQQNLAEIQNRGFELELSADIIKNKDLTWNVTLTGTTYTTKLNKLPESAIPANTGLLPDGTWEASADFWEAAGLTNVSGKYYLRGVGRDWYNIYIYKYAGVDQNTGLPQYWHNVSEEDHKNNKFLDYQPGQDVEVTDRTLASKYELGSALPDWIGGFSTSVRYKGFDLQAVLAYQLGGKYYSNEHGNLLYRGSTLNATSMPIGRELVGNTWTPENTGAKFPMQWYNSGAKQYYDGSIIGDNQYTDIALFSASYLRVKNITLGYTLPQDVISRMKISSLRFFVAGDNLFMASAKKGIDPTMSLTGGFEVGAYTYPTMRTISFGLNLTL